MKQIKSFAIGLLVFFTPLMLVAEEGMWIPSLVKQLNIDRMQELGFKLSAEDIYSINKSSLKDGIVHFGGGCTSELISASGLLLTNYHCGYSRVQSHSSVENDYLTTGYWAANKNDELQCKGLTATLIVRIEDVTERVNAKLTESMTEDERTKVLGEVGGEIIKTATKGTHYRGQIKPYYYGNEYYLIITETFRDVRLVGAPPSSIGKFGGDTDNWIWPRHTGDFALFRIYAGANNLPADYSEDNVPYKPKHFFPISLDGVTEGDFTMVYGFPGRTSQYLTSHGVDQIYSVMNPHAINIRTERLKIIDAAMAESKKVKIQYASKQSRVSNAWKKWQGQNRGLKRYDAINLKKSKEETFTKWVNSNAERKRTYAKLLNEFNSLYASLEPHRLHRLYMNEAITGIEAVRYAMSFRKLHELSIAEDIDEKALEAELEKRKIAAKSYFKNYHQPIDKKMLAKMIELSMSGIPENLQPSLFSEIKQKHKGNLNAYADDVFKSSVFVSEEKINVFLQNYNSKKVKKLSQDPVFKLMSEVINNYISTSANIYSETNSKINRQYRTYMRALRELHTDKALYPDANSSLRITYGKVEGYKPTNGVKYEHITTLEGVIEKYEPGHRDFDAPEKLLDLFYAKDYGPYGVNNTMPIAFVASNHTSGGNSGSPVINANGELIGLNFDRNWIGTMSDIVYDPSVCRNISVDIRYVLFIIDKYAGAKHLINEMKLVSSSGQ